MEQESAVESLRMRCPKCGQEQRFLIDGAATMLVETDSEPHVEELVDFGWALTAPTRCTGCDFEDEFREFEVAGKTPAVRKLRLVP